MTAVESIIPRSWGPRVFVAVSLLIVVPAAFWIFGYGGGYNFFLDDYMFLAIGKYVPNPAVFFVHDYMGEMYRPLPLLYWWVAYRLFGLDAGPYYIIQVMSHLACSLLVGALALNVYRARRGSVDGPAYLSAIISVLYFAFTPVNINTALWLSVINDLFPMALFLAALNVAATGHTRPGGYKKAVIAALVLACCMWKESFVMAAPAVTGLLFFLGFSGDRKGMASAAGYALRETWVYWLVVVVFWAVRAFVIGKFIGGYADRPVGPGIASAVFLAPLWSLYMVVFSTDRLPGLTEFFKGSLYLLVPWLFLLLSGLGRGRRETGLLYVFWFLLGLVPVLSLLLPIKMYNSRFLYFSMMGLSLLFGQVSAGAWGRYYARGYRMPAARTVALAVVAACMAVILVDGALRSRGISRDFMHRQEMITEESERVSRQVYAAFQKEPHKSVWVVKDNPYRNTSIDIFFKLRHPDTFNRLFVVNADWLTEIVTDEEGLRRLAGPFRFSARHYKNPDFYDGYIAGGLIERDKQGRLGDYEGLGYAGYPEGES